MARGSKPGERRGNAKGGPTKETIIKGEAAERVLAQASARGVKLAVDVLEDFMNLFAGMTAFYQPLPDGQTPRPNQNENKFEKYARLTIKVAGDLAPYQSATFRAITVAPAPSGPKGATKKVFTLLVFDNARPQQVSDAAKIVEGKVVKRSTK